MLFAKDFCVRCGRGAETVLGLVFLAGAILKALDINLFVVQVSYYGVVTQPALLSLSAVGTLWVETALGTALILRFRARRWTYVALWALLGVFTILIAHGWIFHDLDDCGCFGPIEMSPAVSVAKNVVLALLGVCAWLAAGVGQREQTAPFSRAVVCVAVASAITLYGWGRLEAGIEPEDSEARPFAQFVFEADGQQWDLGVGEYLVAMLSMTCEHCMESVEVLNQLAQIPEFPVIVGLCYDEQEGELDEFRDLTRPEFPLHSLRDRVRAFFSLTGDVPPRFIYVRDGRQVMFWDDFLPAPDEILKLNAS